MRGQGAACEATVALLVNKLLTQKGILNELTNISFFSKNLEFQFLSNFDNRDLHQHQGVHNALATDHNCPGSSCVCVLFY